MAGQYGESRAKNLLKQGRYDEAVAAATDDLAAEADNPEHLVDRAAALGVLARWDEAVADLERAFELDETALVLETDVIDDAYFSALLGAAKQRAASSPDEAVARLHRYRQVRPGGSHERDVDEWARRLRGEVRKEWVKERA